jgi:anti-anti-sigma factor
MLATDRPCGGEFDGDCRVPPGHHQARTDFLTAVTHQRTVSPPPLDGGDAPVPITPCQIRIARSAGTVVVTVRGEIDAEKAADLGGILADLIDGQGNLSIVVDLQEASATDPDCLWILTEAAERAHRRGASLKVDADADVVRSALLLRGLDAFAGEPPARSTL